MNSTALRNTPVVIRPEALWYLKYIWFKYVIGLLFKANGCQRPRRAVSQTVAAAALWRAVIDFHAIDSRRRPPMHPGTDGVCPCCKSVRCQSLICWQLSFVFMCDHFSILWVWPKRNCAPVCFPVRTSWILISVDNLHHKLESTVATH